MTWPAPDLRIDFQNATVSADTHPGAHNDTNLTLNDDYRPEINRLGSLTTGGTRIYLADNTTVATVDATPVNIPINVSPGTLTVGVGYLLTFQLNFEVVTGVGGMNINGGVRFDGNEKIRATIERGFSDGHRQFTIANHYWVCDNTEPVVTFDMSTSAGVIKTSNINTRRTVLSCVPIAVVNP